MKAHITFNSFLLFNLRPSSFISELRVKGHLAIPWSFLRAPMHRISYIVRIVFSVLLYDRPHPNHEGKEREVGRCW